MTARLSDRYEDTYAEMLTSVAGTPRITPRELSLFWPKLGRRYAGGMLIVGRAVNGWIDRWDLDDDADPLALAHVARETAEGTVSGCPMGWVLNCWKRGDGDSTRLAASSGSLPGQQRLPRPTIRSGLAEPPRMVQSREGLEVDQGQPAMAPAAEPVGGGNTTARPRDQ